MSPWKLALSQAQGKPPLVPCFLVDHKPMSDCPICGAMFPSKANKFYCSPYCCNKAKRQKDFISREARKAMGQ